MTTPDPTTPPFDPFGPAPELHGGASKGCRTIAFAGCGLVLLLLAIAGIAVVFKANELFSWAFGQVGDQIEARLDEDVDVALRGRLRVALDGFSTAVLEGRVSPEALTDAQGRLAEASRAPRISAEAALRLTRALERAAGIELEEPPGAAVDLDGAELLDRDGLDREHGEAEEPQQAPPK